ncbi:GspH/FimT family pseudopilin [Methylibium rhizosphaerae]|uniref:GspH/FimT family pseudopilin n=1 Tax=Methylibium rhizosphaerae TaxID=2570323 RepID=UPI00112D0913|nr:GspH/FimT family pseudopilin [Methylibium rhizosphaerae]
MLIARAFRQAGFSLVELMITLAVFALLMMAAVPSFQAWVAGARVRSVAESLQNSLRMSQTEAVRRSRQTSFVLTNSQPEVEAAPAENGRNWYARVLPQTAGEAASESDYIVGETFASQSSVTVTGPALLCFNSMGRLVSNAATGLGQECVAPASAIEPMVYAISTPGADRELRVQAYLGGKIRMCDAAKKLSDGNPDGC